MYAQICSNIKAHNKTCIHNQAHTHTELIGCRVLTDHDYTYKADTGTDRHTNIHTERHRQTDGLPAAAFGRIMIKRTRQAREQTDRQTDRQRAYRLPRSDES